MKERCSDNNYEMVKTTILHWIENKKVIFYRVCSPKNKDSEKWPFVLFLLTKEMLERAKDITPNVA